jgi:predicted TIM-barrel fold metal-dependent hydrolase
MYGDLSAGSGLNALLRDEAHARAFLARHQDKLLYGSDCSDRDGAGSGCSGSQQIAALRRLAPPDALQKILYGNAARVLRIR